MKRLYSTPPQVEVTEMKFLLETICGGASMDNYDPIGGGGTDGGYEFDEGSD